MCDHKETSIRMDTEGIEDITVETCKSCGAKRVGRWEMTYDEWTPSNKEASV